MILYHRGTLQDTLGHVSARPDLGAVRALTALTTKKIIPRRFPSLKPLIGLQKRLKWIDMDFTSPTKKSGWIPMLLRRFMVANVHFVVRALDLPGLSFEYKDNTMEIQRKYNGNTMEIQATRDKCTIAILLE